MKIKNIIDSNFAESHFPFLPRLFGKYNSFLEDFVSLFRRPSKHNPKLDWLNISVTNTCNANCVFCANRFLKDKREIMSFKLFKKIVDEYLELGGKKEIGLTPTLGDVFVDSGIDEKLDYLKSKGVRCYFYTNALFLDKHIDKILESSVNYLFIDLADIDSKYDSQVYGITKTASEKRKETILKLLEKITKEKSKIKVALSFRPMRKPSKIIREMKKTRFWEYYKKGVFTMSFLQVYDNWGGLIKEKDLKGVQTLKRAPKIKRAACGALYSLSVQPDGDVRLCGCRCLDTLKDELVIGNLNKNSLKEIVSSEKWKKIIEDFPNKRPPVCENCSFYRAK